LCINFSHNFTGISQHSHSPKATLPFTKSFKDEIDNDAIQHNGITYLSCHFLEQICTIIHSTGLHPIWPENCSSTEMLAHTTSEFMLISYALEAHCTDHGFSNNPHVNCIHSPGQNKVNIKHNIKLVPSITIVI
jgi:hypothetical protein